MPALLQDSERIHTGGLASSSMSKILNLPNRVYINCVILMYENVTLHDIFSNSKTFRCSSYNNVCHCCEISENRN